MKKIKTVCDTTSARRCVSAFVGVLLLLTGCAHDPVYRGDPDPVMKLARIRNGSRERLTIDERNAIVAWAEIWFENGKLSD